MKPREWLLAAIGILLLILGARFTRISHGPMHDIVLEQACRAPVSILEPIGRDQPIGSTVVFHGLSASRRIMQTLGQHLAAVGLRVHLVDSPGHGDNTEPFSFARAERCGVDAVEALERRGEIQLDRTVLVGHSMGGAVAIRLAEHFPAAATIAISPAPMVPAPGVPSNMLRFTPPRRMPVNLLIIVGRSEPPGVLAAARSLLRVAGDERFDKDDFRHRRAVKLEVLPRATHTSLLFDSRVEELSSHWVQSALEKNSWGITISRGAPTVGGLLGLAGLLFQFPLAATGLAAAFRARKAEPMAPPQAVSSLLVRWAVVALLVVVVLKFWVPLRALQIYTGDYLASFLLFTGLGLLTLLRGEVKRTFRYDARAIALAIAIGLATIFSFGAWLDWQLTDAWMNAARWRRFAPLLLVCLPYSAAEELAVGPPAADRRWRRFGMFLGLRATLGLALAFALFVLGSDQILVVLLVAYLAMFSLVQRLGADAVRRRTGSAGAAAVFGAILAGWFIAAVLPLT